MVQYRDEDVFIEFKSVGELAGNLPHAIDKLEENRGAVSIGMPVIPMANSLSELVPETKPLLLNKNLEPTQSPIVRIE